MYWRASYRELPQKGSGLQAEFDVGFANVRVPGDRELGHFRSTSYVVLAAQAQCSQGPKRSPRCRPHSFRGSDSLI